MASHSKIITWLIGFPAFVLAHGYVSFRVFEFAFGFAEAGNSAGAIPLGILSMILTPFLVLADLLTLVLPDSAVLPICVLSSSLIWWLVCLKVVSRFRHKNDSELNE